VELANDVTCTRSVIVLDGYLVDVLEWTAPAPVTLTLPVAAGVARGAIGGHGPWQAAAPRGAGGEEDGFGFLRDLHDASCSGTQVTWAVAQHGRAAHAWYAATGTPRLLHARSPGAPGLPETTRVLLESHGASGRIVGVWSWAAPDDVVAVDTVALHPEGPTVAAVTTHCGTRAEHSAADHGWHIALLAGGARSSIDLEGAVAPIGEGPASPASPVAPRLHMVPLELTLGREHYVATEEPYGGDNAPTARVRMERSATSLVIEVHVHTGHALVSAGGTPDVAPENPLDNEPADVNADSLQWYIGDAAATQWAASGLAALLPDGRVRVTPLTAQWAVSPTVQGSARADGWQLRLTVTGAELPATPLRVHVTVNERPPWRERRRGQLRLAGGGFRRYIAGAREDAAACPDILH
jgi:hypothetical protein